MKIKKSAAELIEQRLQTLGEHVGEAEYMYTCLDTGLQFETVGESASFSPFTGSANIEGMGLEEPHADMDYDPELDDIGHYGESTDFMQDTPIPGNQQDPHKQNPLSANPTPSQSSSSPMGDMTQTSANPGEDDDSDIGDDEADPSTGFVPGENDDLEPGEEDVPPFTTKSPGEKT